MAEPRRDLLEQEITVRVEEEEVRDPEIRLACEYGAAPDRTRGSAVSVDAIKQHVEVSHQFAAFVF